jgi:hypothetical protein
MLKHRIVPESSRAMTIMAPKSDKTCNHIAHSDIANVSTDTGNLEDNSSIREEGYKHYTHLAPPRGCCCQTWHKMTYPYHTQFLYNQLQVVKNDRKHSSHTLEETHAYIGALRGGTPLRGGCQAAKTWHKMTHPYRNSHPINFRWTKTTENTRHIP